jgi:NADPH-dependent glutamate synthase beta subunit-like oxidoreductase
MLDVIKAQAPGLATRIGDAEQRAEAKSVAWVGGGPGGVQAEINAWRDLWIEAIGMVSA